MECPHRRHGVREVEAEAALDGHLEVEGVVGVAGGVIRDPHNSQLTPHRLRGAPDPPTRPFPSCPRRRPRPEATGDRERGQSAATRRQAGVWELRSGWGPVVGRGP
eukprot:scaffold356_cov135-Isochrysis_galbana.AAC.7